MEHLSTRSIGFDHIDRGAAEALGIMVENVVYAPDGVADFTLMLILMAIRDMTGIVAAAGRRDFRLSASRGKDLRDLTVGVVGAGQSARRSSGVCRSSDAVCWPTAARRLRWHRPSSSLSMSCSSKRRRHAASATRPSTPIMRSDASSLR